MARTNPDGSLAGTRGLRAAPQKSERADYLRYVITKPRRGARRPTAPIGTDPLEQRAAPGVEGSILERIVYRRLQYLVGPHDIGFIYKRQVGSAPGVNARTFVFGIEIDFIILQNPSGKELALEVLGAHWHGPADQYADQERALLILASGRDYAEIKENEVMLGDEYLDQRLLEIIGVQGRVPDTAGRVRILPGIGDLL